MTTYRVRPSKPMAVFGAVAGVAILVFGVVMMATRSHHIPVAFLVLWVAFGVAIVGFNLWSAFAKNGHVQTLESDDGPPARFGQTVERS